MSAGIRISPVSANLPSGFETLRAEAREEGYRMIERLAAQWKAGEVRFEHSGESLLTARENGAIAGIGGITVEPAIQGAFRMRRFYVRTEFRRSGIGRMIAVTLLDPAQSTGATITVNAGTVGSSDFWESIGFTRHVSSGYTHIYCPSQAT